MRIFDIDPRDLFSEKVKYDLMILASISVTEMCLIYCVLFEKSVINDYFMYLVWIAVLGSTILLIYDIIKEYSYLAELKEKSEAVDGNNITRLCLLNENDGIIHSWSVFGKISLVIGRDVRENHVDVDLSRSKYAGQVSVEHAVMNWANGDWYIEDISEENGIEIRKSNGVRQKLATDTACKLEYGDIIYVGSTRLLVG